MKNLFLSLVLVMVGLVSFSQTPTYLYPNYVVLYVLDSLNVPYVPLPERYGINPQGNKTETTVNTEIFSKMVSLYLYQQKIHLQLNGVNFFQITNF
jgi:uncharacterized protein (DUF488 family)